MKYQPTGLSQALTKFLPVGQQLDKRQDVGNSLSSF